MSDPMTGTLTTGRKNTCQGRTESIGILRIDEVQISQNDEESINVIYYSMLNGKCSDVRIYVANK